MTRILVCEVLANIFSLGNENLKKAVDLGTVIQIGLRALKLGDHVLNLLVLGDLWESLEAGLEKLGGMYAEFCGGLSKRIFVQLMLHLDNGFEVILGESSAEGVDGLIESINSVGGGNIELWKFFEFLVQSDFLIIMDGFLDKGILRKRIFVDLNLRDDLNWGFWFLLVVDKVLNHFLLIFLSVFRLKNLSNLKLFLLIEGKLGVRETESWRKNDSNICNSWNASGVGGSVGSGIGASICAGD